MWWIVTSLVAVVLLAWFTMLMNAPTQCPFCFRVNVFWRIRTGLYRDEEGDLRRKSTEFVCGRCGSQYWIVWDDFYGSRASVSSPSDSGT
jgi:hypothetical protein